MFARRVAETRSQVSQSRLSVTGVEERTRIDVIDDRLVTNGRGARLDRAEREPRGASVEIRLGEITARAGVIRMVRGVGLELADLFGLTLRGGTEAEHCVLTLDAGG